MNKPHTFVSLLPDLCTLIASHKNVSLGDLSRYFGGDVVLSTVVAHAVSHSDPPGKLSAKQFDEDLIIPINRIPRLTSATWKYENGAVGSLMHVVAFHGQCQSSDLNDMKVIESNLRYDI